MAGRRRWEGRGGARREQRVGLRGGQQPLLLGDERVHDAVDGDRLAVAQQEALVALERAREGVAEVHRAEERLLPQVGPDALEHRVDRALDDLVRDGVVLEVARDEPLACGRRGA